MPQFLNPFSGRQFIDANGNPYSGAKLFTYLTRSSTKATTTKDESGLSNHANPIILNTRGEPAETGGSSAAYPIWQTSGQSLTLVLAPANDTDPPTSPIASWDDIDGINDTSNTANEWTAGPSPTFVSTTSFSMAGDQTSTFHVGRRLKLTISGGTVYATILTSTYTTSTLVTLTEASAVLDSGLSAVYYGFLSASNDSIPRLSSYTLQSTDAGASLAPQLILDRNSASPAASDVIGGITFKGRDSGAGTDTYAQIQTEIVDPTAGSEDGKLALRTVVAGTLGTAGYLAQGLVIGSPTGGDKGTGSGNFESLYVQGTALISTTVPLGVLKAGFVNLPQGATRFLGVVGGPGESTEANAEYWVPRPITVSQMRAKLSANVAASQTIAVTLRKNGADTACTFTISAGASTGEDTSNSVDFSTGDRLAIKVVTSAAFGTTVDIGLTLKTSIYNTSIGTTLGFCFNTLGHASTGTDSYGEPGGNAITNAEARGEVPLSASIMGRAFIISITSGGILTTRKNAATISKVVLDGAGDFDPGEYLFAANDLYNIRKTTTGSEESAGYVRLENPPGAAFNFAPAPTFFTSLQQAQNTTFFMGGYLGVASTTEADVQIPMPACTIRSFRAAASAAPPAGQTCTLTLRKNGADTAITCTITSAGRTSSDTSNSVTFAAGDLLSVKSVSSATAGTLTYNVSLEPYVS